MEYKSLYSSEQNRNCITGDRNHLYDKLKVAISKANRIDLIVAFLMESGVRLLVADLLEAAARGTPIRILCGNYLGITQPQALFLLKDTLGDEVDLRFYKETNRSFHPKAYIFEFEDGGELYIGSSNVSHSALTSGIEWNYRLTTKANLDDYNYFKRTFEDLFLNKSIIVDDNEMRRYSKSWRRPKIYDQLERFEDGVSKASEALPNYETDELATSEGKLIIYPRPKGAQIEALYELRKTRQEGWDKGLVVAATGIGKTYLAAFDSVDYKNILFVAHREEILAQAEQAFKHVRPGLKTDFFTGDRKGTDCDILFATIQTIGKAEYLSDKYFSTNHFDYIVIDEFHHAVADSYRRLLEYFKPSFLLGLTATPERLDNKDVFILCDYNTVYELRLKEAINKGWLVPFRYYGIFDDTDYSYINIINGKYDDQQLEEALSINKRADLILNHYKKFNSKRAFAFCSSRKHALFMAEYFSQHGVSSCAVISEYRNSTTANDSSSLYTMERKRAIKMLRNSELKVIFSVDIFNEGVDVPELDMVMFLRPTESPTVFLQQLGRGLRKKNGKSYVNVLDFIGNYKKANLIPFFLTGDLREPTGPYGQTGVIMPKEEDYPDGCYIDLDFRLIDLFKKMATEQMSLFDKIVDEYMRIKADKKDKPLRLAAYTYMDEALIKAMRANSKLNIFKDYLAFLDKIGELTDDELKLKGTLAHDFLRVIENTSMSKTYKMPILLAFYNQGKIKISIDDDDIYESFASFYSKASNAIDMYKDKSTRTFKSWGKKEYVSLAHRNPIRFLQQSSPDFFYTEGDRFCLNPELMDYIKDPVFIKHFKDIIDYRTRRFYKERLEKRLKEIEQYK